MRKKGEKEAAIISHLAAQQRRPREKKGSGEGISLYRASKKKRGDLLLFERLASHARRGRKEKEAARTRSLSLQP